MRPDSREPPVITLPDVVAAAPASYRLERLNYPMRAEASLQKDEFRSMNVATGNCEQALEAELVCDVTVMVVGFNSSAYLVDCLEAIAAAITRHSFEVLFVNNGTDASEALVRRAFPDVRVLDSRGNIGFAAANDYLAEHARGRWLLLLNPDTRLYPGSLDTLLEAAAQNPHLDVLGGVTVGAEGEPETAARLELPSLASLSRTLLLGAPRPEPFPAGSKILEVEALNGGFMMVRRACWVALGGLDRDFFLYAEELDFFKRLRDRGGRAALVADSRLFHDIGSGDIFSASRIRFLTTGNAHYCHKHFSSPYAYACILVMWATAVKRYLGGALFGRRSERYLRMSRAFGPVAKTPWTWMWGYNSAGADPRKSF
jgi:GT2 family glycosyltransferase